MKYEQHPCPLPWLIFRRDGSMWACPCGRVWVVRWVSDWADVRREWQPLALPAGNGEAA